MRSWCSIMSLGESLLSSPAEAGDPVFQRNSNFSREVSAYWIPRFRGVRRIGTGIRSILRLRRDVARGIDAQPAGRGKPLLRQEAALVVHLLGAGDPVAEIDVRQPLAPRARDMVEDHKGAERAAHFGRIEERIDHR